VTKSVSFRLPLDPRAGGAPSTSALWLRPRGASAVLVLAHGAGADMNHAFMQGMADRLGERGIATLRFQFPYSEQGRRAPDRAPVLVAAVRAAVAVARRRARGLPLFAGGKSMGGRMTSLAAAEASLSDVRGLVFFGFPLHASGAPSVERAAHLDAVGVPMLFLQGTRDPLADLDRIRSVCRSLGRRATLHVVEGADHGFHVPRRSGRSDDAALDEIADAVREWIDRR